jgi:hypothetical protein
MKTILGKRFPAALLLGGIAVAALTILSGARVAVAQNTVRLDLSIQLSAGDDRGEAVYVTGPSGLVIDSVFVDGRSEDASAPIVFATLNFPGSAVPPVTPTLTTEGSFQVAGSLTGLGIIVPPGTVLQAEAGRPQSKTNGEVIFTVFGHVK